MPRTMPERLRTIGYNVRPGADFLGSGISYRRTARRSIPTTDLGPGVGRGKQGHLWGLGGRGRKKAETLKS